MVYDWQARTEVYRVRVAAPASSDPSRDPFSLPEPFDLQSDGKVAFSYIDVARERRLGWASPQAPQPHPLAVVTGAVEVRLERDVVVYLRSPHFAASARAELGAVSLSGEARPLVRSVEASSGEEFFDFDGERVAWVERGCAGPRVAFARLGELVASPRVRALPRCRLRLRARPRLTGRGRALALRFDCTGFALPCLPKRALVRTARRYRPADRALPRGTRITRPSRDPSFSPNVRLRLTETGRRLLRARRTIRLEVTAKLGGGLYNPRRQTETTSRR